MPREIIYSLWKYNIAWFEQTYKRINMHSFPVLAGLCYYTLKGIGGKYTKLDQTRKLKVKSLGMLVFCT
jgi:hypothetical protein